MALIGLSSATIHAQGGGFAYTIHVGSLVMAAGERESVDLSITDIGDPVTAWTIEITYDAEVISVTDCLPRKGGVCREDLGGVGRLQVTGASAAGLTRDTVLATITVQCDEVGNSPLALSFIAFDSGLGSGTQAVQIEEGAVTCEEAAEPTSTPLPSLPAAGGGDSPGSVVDWPFIAIVFAGLAIASGFILRALPMRRQ